MIGDGPKETFYKLGYRDGVKAEKARQDKSQSADTLPNSQLAITLMNRIDTFDKEHPNDRWGALLSTILNEWRGATTSMR